MSNESNHKTARLVTISLILEILAFEFFLFACLILLWVKLSHFNEYQAILFVSSALFLFAGSLILGIITACIAPFILPYDRHAPAAPMAFAGTFIAFSLLSLIPGLSGLVIFLIMLRRNRNEGKVNQMQKRMLIAGLVLGNLGIVIFLIWAAYLFGFRR